MKVFVITGMYGGAFGVYTTKRRAKSHREELARNGVATIVTELYVNDGGEDETVEQEPTA